MYLEFMDDEHETRFYEMMNGDGARLNDLDRTVLFYIISGSDELYNKTFALYDHESHSINHENWHDEADFSSGLQGLVSLAFNLYNGYEASPYILFSKLDSYHRELAHRAIRVRFQY